VSIDEPQRTQDRPIDAGMLTIRQVERVVEEPLFRRMEAFSERWLARHEATVDEYGRMWYRDPLHGWSRRWEYPFTFSHLADDAAGRAGVYRVLDAGSGVTFFPHFIQAEIPSAQVTCCDYDPRYVPLFDAINARSERPVALGIAPLQRLPYPDGSFEAVACVSVLEHTTDYPGILREFARVLTPGGLFVGTFDLCLDGRGQISPDGAKDLLRVARELFPLGDVPDLDREAARGDLYTTAVVRRTRPELLPFGRIPLRVSLGALRRGRWVGFGRDFTNLACFGVALRKP
jgi:SAM-dependent methyltransferase